MVNQLLGPRYPKRYLASVMKRAAVILSVALLVVAASFLVRHVRRRAHADQCRNQLRLVAFLLRQYANEHGRLPPSVTYDDGTALRSWRLCAVQTREYFDFARHMDASQPWPTPQNRDFFASFDDDSISHCPSADGGRGITYLPHIGRAISRNLAGPFSGHSSGHSRTRGCGAGEAIGAAAA